MQYTRVEIVLMSTWWLPGVRVAQAVAGPARGVALDPSTLALAQCVISHRRARRLRASRASTDVAAAQGGQQPVMLNRATRVRDGRRVVGGLTRLWVDRTTGRLTHLLVRERGGAGAERIVPAERVAAVARAGITLKAGGEGLRDCPVYRSDAAIEADLRFALESVLAEPRARRAVKVHVADGHVSLAGEVDTTDQARLAERAVLSVPGVREVTIDLVAQETLAAAVEGRIAALEAVAGNGHAHVEVLAEHGIVYLEGTVSSARVRAEIERAALGVAGARVVVNNLRVDGEPPERSTGTGPLVRNR